MTVNFDDETRSAIELAKSSLDGSAHLDVKTLMASLYYGTVIRERLPQLQTVFETPQPVRRADKVRVADDLKAILRQYADREMPVSSSELFVALASSPSGKAYLAQRGLSEEELARAVDSLHHFATQPAAPTGSPPQSESDWRRSAARREAVEALSAFGRMLTDMKHRPRSLVEIEAPLRTLLTNLARMKNRSTIVVGFPGTGKTALVYELARRLVEGDESIPPRLRDLDIFELSPAFLRAGASVVGQYDERVKSLIQVLQAHPKIVLFVDEIHSLLQSGMHGRGPFSEANESFKGPVARGDITIIGCTTLAEFRHYIEPDKALAERFSQIRLEAPSRAATLRMLEARRPQMEQYYHPLRISDPILRLAVELTDDHLPGHYQPRKSLQLLDEACAACVLAQPPEDVLTEQAVVRALENKIGRGVVRRQHLTVDDVFRKLTERIVGQDDVLYQVAEAFVAGLSGWASRTGPRAVFVFGGPTGVGKTEAARQLAQILGGQGEKVIRVDCNTLQGSGFDSGPAINRLLGVPPGYVGYAMGQGGILSRIRDLPESVVLFDEFEKADPGIGKLLLQILDEGKVEDVDGNVLDFRRSFLVFTTNAGCSYDEAPSMGFLTGKQALEAPTAETGAMLNELRAIGLGEEFFGRIHHLCLFRALDTTSVERVVELQLAALREQAAERGLELEWNPDVAAHLASQWKPQFGVRALQGILRKCIQSQLGIAETQGELQGVRRIRLEREGRGTASYSLAGDLVTRRRDRDVLVIALH